MLPTLDDEKEYFYKFINKTDSCWVWSGKLNRPNGYGRHYFQFKFVLAHRLAWFFKYGSYPSGILIHSCDNPQCVNLSHLREGTQKENMQDCLNKGRNKSAKINRNIAVKIKDEYMAGDTTYKKLSSKFGISPVQIGRIVNGFRWGDKREM